jgi:phospholipid-binding lipoprotein MlaA
LSVPLFPLALALAGAAPVAAPLPQVVAVQAEPALAPAEALPPPPAAEADTSDQNAITVTAHKKPPPEDPAQAVNKVSYDAVQAVDKVFIGPVSMTYKHALPAPVRSGLRNFLDNLQEPVVFLNYMLQLKPGKAVGTLGRFALNSTVGVGGLVDVAQKRPFNLPRRLNGFAFTLGYYGVKSGPFLFLPLIGPTSLRDVVGRVIDLSLLPTAFGRPFNRPVYSVSSNAIRAFDDRINNDDRFKQIRAGPVSPYAVERADYLKTRQAQIDELREHRWWVSKKKAGGAGTSPNGTAAKP